MIEVLQKKFWKVMKSILQMESKAEEQKKKSVMNLVRLKIS